MRNRFKSTAWLACALTLLVTSAGVTAQTGDGDASGNQLPQGAQPGFGPGMMGPGYGMGRGYGPGMGRSMTPEQRQQHWDYMRQQGYQPGMGRTMTPEQRQQHWEDMRRQGYGPGMMGPGMMGPGGGMMGPGWDDSSPGGFGY